MAIKKTMQRFSIISLTVLFSVSAGFAQGNDTRNRFRVAAGDSTIKHGDTLFTSCFADKYSMSVCDFRCAYLDTTINKLQGLKNIYLDMYIIRDFIENRKSHSDFEMGFFQWDFNRLRFVKKYFICRGFSHPIYCHVISLESAKKFKKRVSFSESSFQSDFVFIVIRDSTTAAMPEAMFQKETDILPRISYDSISGQMGFASSEIISDIGSFLLDHPEKRAIITLKTNVVEEDSSNAALVIAFRKSFLMPFGLIGLTPENLNMNIAWATKKTYQKEPALMESLLMKIVTK